MPLELITKNLPSAAFSFRDSVFVCANDLRRLAAEADVDVDKALKRGLLCSIGDATLLVEVYERAEERVLYVGMLHRLAGNLPLDAPVVVAPFVAPNGPFVLGTLTVEISPVSALSKETVVDASELATLVQTSFNGHVYKNDQKFAIQYRAETADSVSLKFSVTGMEFVDVDGSGAPGRFGMLKKTTDIKFVKSKTATNLKLTGSTGGSKANQLFEKGFNFEEMGIGGLDAQFKEIFRRAFASRLVPAEILRKMGQNHVRGMLLYGPPGCGKTLIARKIAKALHARPPKIVNGPEILNKYVGQSEENIRMLFKEAEEEQAEKGDDSDLHIIIFDEIDAICKQRGTTGGSTGVNDSIVNQLLSKIDGVEALNNILLIGMTNRKDMIDEAIIRPGRLELHVEIGLPDEAGRLQILKIHTNELKNNSMMADDVDLLTLAEHTKNYTGAEVEGMVKAACSYVFTRQIDMSDLSKTPDFKGVQVSMADFMRAIDETQPAFGVREDELKECFANGIINHGMEFEVLQNTLGKLVNQVKNAHSTKVMSVLLTGASGTGKSALAAFMAQSSMFPFVKRISGETLVGMHDDAKSAAIQKCFNDSYKSPLSIVILDDLERLFEYVAVGPRFSNQVLQTLLVLCKANPPNGHKLLVIGTTAIPDMLEQMEVTNAFQLRLDMPQVKSQEQLYSVFKGIGKMREADVVTLSKRMADRFESFHPLGIKKLISIIEMARQDQDGNPLPEDVPTSLESIETVLSEWGIF